MRILISACLLGVCCRYDGKSKACAAALRLAGTHELVPVCPEQLGGLPTPRPPAEIRDGRVVNAEGRDVTAAFQKGAEETLRLCRALSCQCAVLKANSPSCGRDQVYDGTFAGVLTPGSGVTAALLMQSGVRVLTEQDLNRFGLSEEAE